MAHLSLLFPVRAEKAEYSTLLELEFENLENPDPVESTSDRKTRECPKIILSSEASDSSPHK